MYTTGTLPATAGIAALPNTGGDTLLTTLAVISIVIGVAVLATSVARIAFNRSNG